jgi:hypothetical protein
MLSGGGRNDTFPGSCLNFRGKMNKNNFIYPALSLINYGQLNCKTPDPTLTEGDCCIGFRINICFGSFFILIRVRYMSILVMTEKLQINKVKTRVS